MLWPDCWKFTEQIIPIHCKWASMQIVLYVLVDIYIYSMPNIYIYIHSLVLYSHFIFWLHYSRIYIYIYICMQTRCEIFPIFHKWLFFDATREMLHHPRASPSKYLIKSKFQNSCVGDHTCWKATIHPAGSATMATQAWAINASHSNHQLRSMQGNSSRVWVVELVVYVWCFCDSQLALSRGHPTHTQHRLIWSKLPCMLQTHSTLCSPRSLSHQRWSLQ